MIKKGLGPLIGQDAPTPTSDWVSGVMMEDGGDASVWPDGRQTRLSLSGPLSAPARGCSVVQAVKRYGHIDTIKRG